jgi:hypothetical protein
MDSDTPPNADMAQAMSAPPSAYVKVVTQTLRDPSALDVQVKNLLHQAGLHRYPADLFAKEDDGTREASPIVQQAVQDARTRFAHKPHETLPEIGTVKVVPSSIPVTISEQYDGDRLRLDVTLSSALADASPQEIQKQMQQSFATAPKILQETSPLWHELKETDRLQEQATGRNIADMAFVVIRENSDDSAGSARHAETSTRHLEISRSLLKKGVAETLGHEVGHNQRDVPVIEIEKLMRDKQPELFALLKEHNALLLPENRTFPDNLNPVDNAERSRMYQFVQTQSESKIRGAYYGYLKYQLGITQQNQEHLSPEQIKVQGEFFDKWERFQPLLQASIAQREYLKTGAAYHDERLADERSVQTDVERVKEDLGNKQGTQKVSSNVANSLELQTQMLEKALKAQNLPPDSVVYRKINLVEIATSQGYVLAKQATLEPLYDDHPPNRQRIEYANRIMQDLLMKSGITIEAVDGHDIHKPITYTVSAAPKSRTPDR